MSTQHGFMPQFPKFYFPLHRLLVPNLVIFAATFCYFRYFFVPCSCRESGRHKRLRIRIIKKPQISGLFPKRKVCRVSVCDCTKPAAQHQTIWKDSLHAQVRPRNGNKRGKIHYSYRKDVIYSVWILYYCIIEDLLDSIIL